MHRNTWLSAVLYVSSNIGQYCCADDVWLRNRERIRDKGVKMNENLLRRIKRQLNAKFYVMNDAWLRDCVEFFVKDKNPHEMTDKHIFEFVESQWQLSDLREISNENGCLPRNLAQQTRIVLTDTYILQVDKMYDIASSKYKQLCEIRKIDNQNLEVALEEEEKKEQWQPKGRRMMQLCLTDGVQDVTAIEYTPLKQITGALLPGYKVMIIGPVDCRRGVILLEDSKYKEVGGEVDSLLKPNAPENVLARALGEPENPDPYNDNGPFKIANHNSQNVASGSNNDNFFDDDFEEAIDLEAVTAIERRSQEIEAIQERSENTCNNRQTARKETNEMIEETLQDIDFEPFENWPSDSPSRIETKKLDDSDIIIIDDAPTCNFRSKSPPPTSSHKNQNFLEFPDDDFDLDDCDVIIKTKELQRPSDPPSRIETKKIDNSDIIIIDDTPTSTCNFRSKSPPPTSSHKNRNFLEFSDDDFDFDDCDVTIKTKESQSQQGGNPLKNKTCAPIVPLLESTNSNSSMEVEKCISTKTVQNEKPMASTSRTIQQMPKIKPITNFFKPLSAPKICDVLSDVLREPITEKICRTVRGQVKTITSALTKRGKCWSVTAVITDHTSSVEVCFNSEILEEFLGFTVQEFSQKKKLAKSNPQVDNELRMNLRKAQHDIQNLDALLKLELVQGEMTKVIGITQLTAQQKKDLNMKRPA
ncbi:recQ-mediated genome instability protein 1-like isoform X1 [Temnothorax curvispinosus]|uniref:RecQ-mediated genome instability protein 1 n=2 Tax=Temnothorax curvispinosus TaxID=300111 RepID=A0A6J1PE46_9HYME|nr:recQ-mediated genome instability protein 1-like isoform X1 [Temnothorax curvispinosus]